MTRRRSSPISKNFKAARRRLMNRIEASVVKWAWSINYTSVLPVTPKDTNKLRLSIYVEPIMTFNGVRVEVGFNTPYAPKVHEWPAEGINWTTAGTGPKYLQTPYFSNSGSLRPFIVKHARF